HKLLQGNLKVKNLGLIIIDEEHRFGVLHKERLKKIDPSVDVLSISATPIPRTLQMALGGLRNISMISTPPHNRRQVMTYAGPWRDDLFRESVIREIARGGQIFYVHNRIDSIEKVALGIRRQFPGVAVDIAHGRMEEKALENAMSRFASRKTDLLVCTTIIESGLDLPGANTLVVDNAQDLGLAQMYQLRGRVGRREEQAYALFFYPSDQPLHHEAMERLEAIAGMDGSDGGFALAKRDMEIRGGGQIAGTRQHGHVERVGYHSYFKILEEEISLASGKKSVPVVNMDIRLPVVLPSAYVPQSSVRIVIFRKLLKVSNIREIEDLRNELRERFGPLPKSVDFMLASAVVRTLGPYHGLQYVRCNLRETCAAGEANQISCLPRRGGWLQKMDGTLVGPGGYSGMLELAGMINSPAKGKTEGL
ncbi:MAG TPA: transcription-repair coupling factor, partial [Synergistetes bacterium]|nr:transcription-repair coupling factor [Synergistota bacterium]